jgi:hypothetical protein
VCKRFQSWVCILCNVSWTSDKRCLCGLHYGLNTDLCEARSRYDVLAQLECFARMAYYNRCNSVSLWARVYYSVGAWVLESLHRDPALSSLFETRFSPSMDRHLPVPMPLAYILGRISVTFHDLLQNPNSVTQTNELVQALEQLRMHMAFEMRFRVFVAKHYHDAARWGAQPQMVYMSELSAMFAMARNTQGSRASLSATDMTRVHSLSCLITHWLERDRRNARQSVAYVESMPIEAI